MCLSLSTHTRTPKRLLETNESYYTYDACRTYKCVKTHLEMSHFTYMNVSRLLACSRSCTRFLASSCSRFALCLSSSLSLSYRVMSCHEFLSFFSLSLSLSLPHTQPFFLSLARPPLPPHTHAPTHPHMHTHAHTHCFSHTHRCVEDGEMEIAQDAWCV